MYEYNILHVTRLENMLEVHIIDEGLTLKNSVLIFLFVICNHGNSAIIIIITLINRTWCIFLQYHKFTLSCLYLSFLFIHFENYNLYNILSDLIII